MSQELFNFETRDAVSHWAAIDDSVMGGVSASVLSYHAAGFAVFRGTVSLANGGGFASVRSRAGAFAAPGAVAYTLEVCGDGKRYKLNLRTDDAFDGVNYQAPFEPPAGEWSTVRLALAAFAPRFRGRPVAAPPLDPRRVRQFGLMIADRQAGPFELKLRRISAV